MILRAYVDFHQMSQIPKVWYIVVFKHIPLHLTGIKTQNSFSDFVFNIRNMVNNVAK